MKNPQKLLRQLALGPFRAKGNSVCFRIAVGAVSEEAADAMEGVLLYTVRARCGERELSAEQVAALTAAVLNGDTELPDGFDLATIEADEAEAHRKHLIPV